MNLRDQFDMMEPFQRKLAVIVASVIGVIGIALILYGIGFVTIRLPLGTTHEAVKQQEQLQKMSARDAFNVAQEKAHAWHGDAMLASLTSGSTGELGRSDAWTLVFVSSHAKGKGYMIEIDDRKIASASEIQFQGAGAEFPSNIISPEQAIERVRAIKGYESVDILAVEAIYGSKGKIWYWGVKTPRGVISVKAD